MTDQQLLQEYTDLHSESAFTELVRRHINLVHSAALRMTGEAHSAQDVTQSVFVALAQNAGRLAKHPVLPGWLHTTARNLAAKTVRSAVRRQYHEQEAAAMNQCLSEENDASWDDVAPHLDACLGKLNASERDVLLLRYFEKKSAPEIAGLLGISDVAAQKRVYRAVDRLRTFFADRGVKISVGGLAVIIGANAVNAAPVGLTVTVVASALVAPSVSSSALIATTTKAIAMTTLQKAVVTVTIATLAGTGIYEARQVAQLREQNNTLLVAHAQAAKDLDKLKNERDQVSNRLARLHDANERSTSNQNDILKTRGEVGLARRQANEANQRAQVAEQKLSSALSSSYQFLSHENATVNAGKMLGLALHSLLMNTNAAYPTNIAQLNNELGGTFEIGGIDLFAFEMLDFKLGMLDQPNRVALRERLSRQTPDGRWSRIYVFADGSVQTAKSNDGNFDAWEQENTARSSATPTSR